jgi:hypothetical protein
VSEGVGELSGDDIEEGVVDSGDWVGVEGERGIGNEQFWSKQKISTIFTIELPFHPPPKNILFWEDVDASQ